ncbi:hypothetical protein NDN08_006893 [Rhodosorus marinus]|uniref:Pantoate--beta-alanine ligase n=1 Tax=Rhodosorus marinus TaxID=101924 RepID=A0AAV8UIX0_9RHOD|nr:hypothetical protein NDN08_006893 [Rhodosorus marinus]
MELQVKRKELSSDSLQMKVLESIEDFRSWREAVVGDVGVVTTMGYLHRGHESLIRAAREQNKILVATIFVNPAQFAPGEDLEAYPRDEEGDLETCRLLGVDAVFMPPRDQIYPPGFGTYVETESGKSSQNSHSEGSSRPTFFRGVATVVLKLFNIIQPKRAYFGRKDAQQCVVIQNTVRDLNVPVEIIIEPTVREHDGLALSSRNAYLNREERSKATILYSALTAGVSAFKNGETDADELRNIVKSEAGKEEGFTLDYVSVADMNNMKEQEGTVKTGILAIAGHIGKTRLIDNMILE